MRRSLRQQQEEKKNAIEEHCSDITNELI